MTEPLVGQINFEGLAVVGLFDTADVGALLGVGVGAVLDAVLAVELPDSPRCKSAIA